METQTRPIVAREPYGFAFAGDAGDRDIEERINRMLQIRESDERENSLYHSETERFEAQLMKNPIPTEKAVAYFGLMLGLFPPCAIFCKFLFAGSGTSEAALVFLLALVNSACAVTGYFSGKMIGRNLTVIEKLSWHRMLLAAPFLGILWGIITGAAGGVLIVIIGAFFGALIASIVGALALPAFALLHRALKKGDLIEEKHFFPIALGITAVITAFILGL